MLRLTEIWINTVAKPTKENEREKIYRQIFAEKLITSVLNLQKKERGINMFWARNPRVYYQ